MVEQVSRPFFLSVFGVVPGVPASGRLDHILLADQQQVADNQLENRMKLEPVHDEPAANKAPPKTGNPLFDVGNSFFNTFQRANDATNGLYCVKQYMVNRVWDRFRLTVRQIMKSIPTMV